MTLEDVGSLELAALAVDPLKVAMGRCLQVYSGCQADLAQYLGDVRHIVLGLDAIKILEIPSARGKHALAFAQRLQHEVNTMYLVDDQVVI